MESESLTLILEMAKTASLLSSQLMQLHKNLSLNSTPKNKIFFQSLTPISSGYNSLKASCESLTCYSKKYPISQDLSSLVFNSTSSDLDSSSSTKMSSSFIEMETQSIKKCLLFDESMPFREHNAANQAKMATPFKRQLPEIPRIKEVRELSKKKKFFNINKQKIIKCLNMSSSSM